jgi:DNA-binding Xre family transcriptional regulator
MKKTRRTNWDRFYAAQIRDPEFRAGVEEELRALRVGAELARLRQRRGLSQTQLAAKAGMSGPNVSRIETSPGQNLTLQTLGRLARALGRDVTISFPRRQAPRPGGKRGSRRSL